MAYLQVDGFTIPVATAYPKQSFDEIGGFARASSGAGVLSRRKVKRTWDIETTPMSEAQASAFEAILLASGLLFQFDDNAFASNGYTPTIDNLEFLDGRVASVPMYDVNDVPFGHRFDRKSLVLDAPSSNSLTQNQSTFDTDTTGCTAIDSAALTQDAAYGMDADGGLRVVTSASVNGTRGGVYLGTTVSSTAKICVSAYVRADTAITVRVVAYNGVREIYKSVTLEADVWTRISVAIIEGTTGTTAGIFVLEDTADSNVTFYVDHAQVEGGIDYPTAWMTGGTSRATSGQVELADDGIASFDDVWTMAFWFRLPASVYALASASTLCLWNSDNIAITAEPGNIGTTVFYWDIDVTIGNATSGTFVLTDRIYVSSANWHHMALTFAHDGSGGTTATLFVDGVEEDTGALDGSMAGFFSLNNEGAIDVGSDAGSDHYASPIFQFLLVPTVLTDNLLSMVYNSGDGVIFGAWPRHKISGGILYGQESIDGYIQLGQGSPVDFCDSDGVWQPGRTIKFTIREA